jgi:hypothetical protein
MKKLIITTALAVVLAGGAYAQDHHGRGGGGPGGGGGGMMSYDGGPRGGSGGPSMMSPGPSGPSNFGRSSSFNGPSSQFSHNNQGLQGRTLFNQEPRNRDIRGDQRGQLGRLDRDDLRHGRNLFNRERDFDRRRFDGENRIGRDIDRDRDRDIDFRHRGIVRGDFFEHGRHFRFRRFFHGEWVFLTDFDDCTAWAWVHVAPGVWAWRPVDICIG